MNCITIHNKLIFFLEKDLPASELEQIQQHLDVCSDCAQFVEEMKKTLDIIEEEKTYETNPFFYTKLKARLENQEKVILPKRPLVEHILQPAAFIIILLVGIYGGIKLGKPHKPSLTNNTISEQQLIPYLNEMDAEPIEAFLME